MHTPLQSLLKDYEEKMSRPSRPLSPHLGIYKWQLHMALSILHRATGVFLGLGLFVLAWWLMAIATGPDAYASFIIYASNPLGRLVLFGFSYALIFHAINGVRHLVWDTGSGLDVDSVKASGYATLSLSVVLTVLLWVFGYIVVGKI